ncbi:Ran-binding protein [Sporothrix schenckii 1099-18]|uniref:Ran-binding protein n=1 Tax=Sporothrix schenckii 1099-18 TaxID=1397361 RepID=A0A0F2LW52_SPOSC|nr:Ran-binding protein [Sporothrix schenckii 1099-18]KJR81059.1 Ran-binding protein [Sporothrix schenckii 1099-18]
METPQKRPKSWFSSLTGLVSAGRNSSREATTTSAATPTPKTSTNLVNGDRASSRIRLARPDEQATPARYSGTFSAPPVESPESPAKRASPTQLAQRKIHDRVQGPSGRLGTSSNTASSNPSNTYSYGNSHNLYSSSSLGRPTSTPRRTNFSSATTPRNMFRDSMARDMPAFTFTPRVPVNTLRGSFPATTPGRSHRAPGAELSAREMAKVTSSELFQQKIPDPDPKLSAEAMTDMLPSDLRAGGQSVYANEFLAHLCPPDFNEEQRNQFFCILDLRRLKYAADEVFLKKDWKLNISNFAKEYEKNRSLIMLRYGLYEFKTVKVSKDTFTKWKQDHNIPSVPGEEDEEELMVNPADLSKSARSSSKPNGTEGILRTGKRKAQDNIDPNATTSNASTFQPAKKRTRADGSKVAADREPLLESSTPSLNKTKRKATRGEGVDQLQRAKQQKPTPAGTPSSTPSATKAFFEKVANSPAKETAQSSAAGTPTIKVTQPSLDGPFGTKNTTSPFKSSALASSTKPSTNGSLARSVLESGLKSASGAAQNSNIFGYLSDASSAKGSGNDNADADGEDTDDSDADAQDESEAQEGSDNQSASVSGSASVAPPSASLFAPKSANPLLAASSQNASASSSEASDATPGRSLFDRVNKGSDGQPIRMFGGNDGSSPSFQSAPAAASSATPLFSSKPTSERASPEKEPATSSLFGGANKTWTPDSPIKFAGGASTTPGKPLFGSATSTTPAAAGGSAAISSPFKFGTAAAPASSATAPATEKPAASEKPADDKAADDKAPADSSKESTSAPPAAAAPPLFAFSNKSAETGSSSPSLFGASATKAPASSSTGSLFGAAATPATGPATLFGKTPSTTPSSAPAFGASQTLFGNATKTDTPSFGQKRSADEDSAPKAAPSLFGNAVKSGDSNASDEPQSKKTMFGASSSGPAAPGSSTPLFSFGASKTDGDADKSSSSATSKAQENKPLFGSAPVGGATEAPQTQSPSLFGNSTPSTAATAPAATAATTPSFSFGGNNATTPAAQPSGGAIFSFGASSTQPQQSSAPAPSTGFSFGGGSDAGSVGSGGSSFTFNAGGAGGASQPFRNPFASGADSSAASQPPSSFSFGAGGADGQSSTPSTSMFQFGGGAPAATPTASTGGAGGLFSFGGGSQTTEPATTPGNSFGGGAPSAGNGSAIFSFGGGTPAQASSTPLFGQQKPAGAPMFNLAPPLGGASSGTNTPFTNLGGASSLATTPASGTPEPGATQDNTDNSGHQADGDEAPQEQISLTDGGPGEEDEAAVHEVRAKALRLSTGNDDSGSESPAAKEKKSPWKTEGVGPLRVLKNKTTGHIRLLLRAEPRGHVALNRALLPDFTYKPEPNAKYVKLTTSNEAGNGLETWMLQVKTKEAAQKLAEVLEEHKASNKK